jgi:hypothetical protein
VARKPATAQLRMSPKTWSAAQTSTIAAPADSQWAKPQSASDSAAGTRVTVPAVPNAAPLTATKPATAPAMNSSTLPRWGTPRTSTLTVPDDQIVIV